MRLTRICVLLLICCAAPLALAQAPSTAPATTRAAHNFAKWEKAIAKFEAADREKVPPKHAVLFVGSSTILRWKSLAADFPGVTVLNRGFGGSQIIDSAYYAERMIFPYEPRMIVLRAGSNDISAGKSAEQVLEDYKTFVAKVRSRLPDVPIVFISMCPTIARWKDTEENRKLNELVQAYTKETPGLKYVDAWDISLDADGKPRPEIFVADNLHLSEEGYRLMTERVRPVVLTKENVDAEVKQRIE